MDNNNNDSNELEIDTKLVDQNQNQNANKIDSITTGNSSQAPIYSCQSRIFLKLIIPISMIIVGAVYSDHKHCTAAGKIALLLILGGFVCMVDCFLSTLAFAKRTQTKSSKEIKTDPADETQGISPRRLCIFRFFVGLLDLAVVSIFLVTSAIVFRLYPNVNYENKGDTNYCNKGLFIFAFIYLLVVYSFLILCLLIIICGGHLWFRCECGFKCCQWNSNALILTDNNTDTTTTANTEDP